MEGVVQFARVVALGQVEPMENGGQPGVEVVGMTTPVFYDEFRRLEAGRRLLNSLVGGGEVGRGVDMAVWEFRRFKAVSWRSMRLEWSYRRKSRLDFMVFLYRWSMVSSLCTLFVWITFWSAEVRSRMGWSAVGRGRWTLIGEVWVASLLLSASSRLRTWLVGVQQIMHPWRRQGEILVHVL